MIKSIKIKKTGSKHFTNKLYHNKNKDIIYNFTDGVNIITGRNASGKTVLLKMLSVACGILERNYPSMPSPMDLHLIFDRKWISMEDFIKSKNSDKGFPDTEVDWDKMMVYYLNPESFSRKSLADILDDDPNKIHKPNMFSGIEAISEIMSNKSSGQGAISVLTKMYNLDDKFDEPPKDVNSTWEKASDIYQDWLKSYDGEKGKPTLLIDEMDSRLDIDNQKTYWDFLEILSKKWQIIVVSHSIFAFSKSSKEYNYINLNSDYYNKVKKIIKTF